MTYRTYPNPALAAFVGCICVGKKGRGPCGRRAGLHDGMGYLFNLHFLEYRTVRAYLLLDDI